jgi:type IV fimbrial biogenesis protein FimT
MIMKNNLGFTLMEAMVSLAIISILGMITVAGLSEMSQRANDDAVLADLFRLIEAGRNEAELRHQTITLCHSENLQSCGGEWGGGLILFIDKKRDGVIHHSSQIILVNKLKTARGNLHARFFPFYREYVQFNPLNDNINDNGTFWYCRRNALQPSWAVRINRMGIINILKPDSNGDITDHSGTKFNC